MPRGGKRVGRSGVSYPQRTDLNQAPRAATGQEYGKAGEQLAAQRAVPLPHAQPVAPIDAKSLLNAPTAHPERPVTHGLPVGPGAGPEVLGLPDLTDSGLRAAYAERQSEELRELIEAMEEGW